MAGWPVRHSLSPLLHNLWLEAAGIDGLYAPVAVPPGRFAPFVEGARHGIIRGLNVTAPHKLEALALATRVHASAARAGSANLLLFDAHGAIEARSTDGAGLLAALAQQAPALGPAAGHALVLGAGGAGRAAAAALLDAGWSVVIANRTPARAEEIAAAIPGLRTAPWDRLAPALADAALLVDATASSDPPPLDSSAASPALVVMDMRYDPLVTPLLAAARARGHATVDGLAMLIGQAIPSFEALFGRPPPTIDVRSPAEAQLAARAQS